MARPPYKKIEDAKARKDIANNPGVHPKDRAYFKQINDATDTWPATTTSTTTTTV